MYSDGASKIQARSPDVKETMMPMQHPAPVALFVYNRPESTIRCVNSLKSSPIAKFTDLHIFSDNARIDSDVEKVALVRDFIKRVDGFASVSIHLQETNIGLAGSLISGTTAVIQQYGRVIVVEDDLVVSVNFLEFMNRALEFYEGDENILSVSGYSGIELNPSDGVYFSLRASSWGWATWRDRWMAVDWAAPEAESDLASRQFRRNFSRGGADLPRMLQSWVDGRIDSWAIRFVYHQAKRGLVSVVPNVSKVINKGFGDSATHTKMRKAGRTPRLDDMDVDAFQFRHFDGCEEETLRKFREEYSIWNRLLVRIRVILAI